MPLQPRGCSVACENVKAHSNYSTPPRSPHSPRSTCPSSLLSQCAWLRAPLRAYFHRRLLSYILYAMDHRVTALERAFQVAKSGKCSSVADLKKQLHAE